MQKAFKNSVCNKSFLKTTFFYLGSLLGLSGASLGRFWAPLGPPGPPPKVLSYGLLGLGPGPQKGPGRLPGTIWDGFGVDLGPWKASRDDFGWILGRFGVDLG